MTTMSICRQDSPSCLHVNSAAFTVTSGNRSFGVSPNLKAAPHTQFSSGPFRYLPDCPFLLLPLCLWGSDAPAAERANFLWRNFLPLPAKAPPGEEGRGHSRVRRGWLSREQDAGGPAGVSACGAYAVPLTGLSLCWSWNQTAGEHIY